MNTMSCRKNRQSGLSLVELMIGIALGLLLTGAALSMLIVSKETYRTTNTLSRVQENARYALDTLAKSIRLAGYRDPEYGGTLDPIYDGECGSFDPCTENGAGNASDRIALWLDPPPNDGTETDCTGSVIEAEQDIANVYYVAETADDVFSLVCRGYDVGDGSWVASAQPLIDGIDRLQILYGLIEGGRINQYVSADRVPEWHQVGAVRVSLLVSTGQETGSSDEKVREFLLLDAEPLVVEDRHERKTFSTTVAIHNQFNET